MKVNWTLLWLQLMLGLVACAMARDCNVTQVMNCYDNLVHYEGLGFPFYGENELELDDTCRVMNDSFDCLEVYVQLCRFRDECDKDCQQIISDIETFSINSGIMMVQQALCEKGSVMRHAYLESYSCLESNMNSYAACHNDSQLSQDHLNSINDTLKGIEARCCFFTWYQDCFTNITRDTCSENATVFVSFTLHTLIGHISHSLCGPTPHICDTPPLPPHHTKVDDDDIIPLDDGHYDITDLDGNSIDGGSQSLAASRKFSLRTMGVALGWILLTMTFVNNLS